MGQRFYEDSFGDTRSTIYYEIFDEDGNNRGDAVEQAAEDDKADKFAEANLVKNLEAAMSASDDDAEANLVENLEAAMTASDDDAGTKASELERPQKCRRTSGNQGTSSEEKGQPQQHQW